MSGIHYDPDLGVEAYYTLIDQQEGNLRPLYYVQSGGDFMLPKNGEFGQCNKIVMDNRSWEKKAIYSVKSPNYRQGLLKMFKDRIKEGNK